MKNTGTTDVCRVALTAGGVKLSEALKASPAELPVLTSIKLAPGEAMDFSFLLPIDAKLGSAPFVGLSDKLAPCSLVDQVKAGATEATGAATEAAADASAAATKAGEVATEAANAAIAELPKLGIDPESIPKVDSIIQTSAELEEADKQISPAAKLGAGFAGLLTVAAVVAAQLLL